MFELFPTRVTFDASTRRFVADSPLLLDERVGYCLLRSPTASVALESSTDTQYTVHIKYGPRGPKVKNVLHLRIELFGLYSDLFLRINSYFLLAQGGSETLFIRRLFVFVRYAMSTVTAQKSSGAGNTTPAAACPFVCCFRQPDPLDELRNAVAALTHRDALRSAGNSLSTPQTGGAPRFTSPATAA